MTNKQKLIDEILGMFIDLALTHMDKLTYNELRELKEEIKDEEIYNEIFGLDETFNI